MPDRLPLGRAQRVRPFAHRLRHRAQRFARRENDDRQHEQRHRRRPGQHAAAESEGPDEQAEAEQSVNDRRHAGEVGDIDLDDARQPVALSVLLEIDRRRHADRQRENRRQPDQVERADERRVDARVRRTSRRKARQELPVQPAPAIGKHVVEQRTERRRARARRR